MIFPLLRPAVITVIVVSSVAVYNDFVNPLYFLPGTDNATVQLTLFNFQSQFNTHWNLLFADVLLITIPPLIMFIFFQRQIVSGMTAGAVKGMTLLSPGCAGQLPTACLAVRLPAAASARLAGRAVRDRGCEPAGYEVEAPIADFEIVLSDVRRRPSAAQVAVPAPGDALRAVRCASSAPGSRPSRAGRAGATHARGGRLLEPPTGSREAMTLPGRPGCRASVTVAAAPARVRADGAVARRACT